MRRVVPDIVCGLFALALAGAYYAAAVALPTSFLSDEVGADGLPKLLAIALGFLGILAIVRAALPGNAIAAGPIAETNAMPAAGSRSAAPVGIAVHIRALGMLMLGVLYALLAPWLGYLVATIALLFLVAAYSGQKPSLRLAAISGTGGLVLWVAFAKLLGMAMPAGVLAPLLG